VLVLALDAILVSGSNVEDSRGGVEVKVVLVLFGDGASVFDWMVLGDVELSIAVVLCDRGLLAVVNLSRKNQ
jgi:hypothetical protein